MKKWITSVAVIALWFVSVPLMLAQTSDEVLSDSINNNDQGGLRKVFSDRPFFGTQRVLTINGDYVNTPHEDYEQLGIWTMPLTLDQMHGLIGEVAFGEDLKQGQWRLSYRYKVADMDSDWAAIAYSNQGMTTADRSSQVLKASYNVRYWWKLGVAAIVQDKYGYDSSYYNQMTFGATGREGLGLQLDTTLKF